MNIGDSPFFATLLFSHKSHVAMATRNCVDPDLSLQYLTVQTQDDNRMYNVD